MHFADCFPSKGHSEDNYIIYQARLILIPLVPMKIRGSIEAILVRAGKSSGSLSISFLQDISVSSYLIHWSVRLIICISLNVNTHYVYSLNIK